MDGSVRGSRNPNLAASMKRTLPLSPLALALFVSALPLRAAEPKPVVWYLRTANEQYLPRYGDTVLLQFSTSEGGKYIEGGVLDYNTYLTEWGGTGPCSLGMRGVTFFNKGTFTDSVGLIIGTPDGVFHNSGTFIKEGPAERTLFEWGSNVVNTGTFEARTGRIDFAHVGASYTFNDGSRFVGAGLVRVLDGYTTFSGNFYSENLQLVGATNSFRGTNAVGSGTWGWLGSTLTGTWGNTGTLTIVGAGGQRLDYGAQLTNAVGATIRHESSGLGFAGDARLVNHGTFTSATDNSFGRSGGSGGQPSFANDGLFEKTGGTGQTRFDAVRLDNLAGGTVRIRSGQLYTNTAMTNAGTLDVGGGTSFRTDAAFTNTGSIVGTGTIYAQSLVNEGTIAPGYSPGTLTVDGNVILGSDSILNLEFGGPGGSDQFIVTGEGSNGNLQLGGTLNILSAAGYTPTLGDSWQLFRADSLTGSFDHTYFTGFGSGVTFGLSQDSGGFFATVTAIPEPSTYAAIFGGLTLALVAWRRWRAQR